MRVSTWHNMHLPYMYIFEYDSSPFLWNTLKRQATDIHVEWTSANTNILSHIRFIALVKHALYITTKVDVIVVGQDRSIPLLLNANLSFKTCGGIVVRKVTISRQIWWVTYHTSKCGVTTIKNHETNEVNGLCSLMTI